MTDFPLHYQEPIFRPPSEARSVLLPVTLGCSHNKCTYCAMYQTKKYRVRSWNEIAADLKSLSVYFRSERQGPRRFFLCDGDAMSADTSLLEQTAALAKELFLESFERISLYANVTSVLRKSHEELVSLRQHSINLAYIGMESGWDPLLSMIHKGHDAAQLVAACRALREAGIKTSLIVMIGLAGAEASAQHALATAAVLSAIVPDYLSFLVTTPIAGTAYERQVRNGVIKPLTTHAIFAEMVAIIEGLSIPANARVTFRANHVSNLMPLRGELPCDAGALTADLKRWMAQCPKEAYPNLNPMFL